LRDFKWDVFPHPPYSPDLAASDFHLFPHLHRWLGGRRFSSDDEVKTAVHGYFENLDGTFYYTGIEKLVARFDKCLNLDGDYVEK
jgi:histone-lysine N-methyltransferase SETMAR